MTGQVVFEAKSTWAEMKPAVNGTHQNSVAEYLWTRRKLGWKCHCIFAINWRLASPGARWKCQETWMGAQKKQRFTTWRVNTSDSDTARFQFRPKLPTKHSFHGGVSMQNSSRYATCTKSGRLRALLKGDFCLDAESELARERETERPKS